MGEPQELSPEEVLAVFLTEEEPDAARLSHLSYVDCKYMLINHLKLQGQARELTTSERRCVSAFVNMTRTGVSSLPASHISARATILMAYTDNYRLGDITALVNEAYANKHGYRFRLHKKSYEEMMGEISPRDNPTWYKVRAINEELLQNDSTESVAEYILWLDADAMLVNHDLRVEDVARACEWRDLVISEDLHEGSSCLINAGVMLIKKSDFSRKLFCTMWLEESKYNTTIYYEQSALQQQLRKMGEGVENVHGPFFSASRLDPALVGREHFSSVETTLAAMRRDCLTFSHCKVLPCHLFNTNVYLEDDPRGGAARFVYHAAGRGKSLQVFWDIIERRGLMVEALRSLREREGNLNNIPIIRRACERVSEL